VKRNGILTPISYGEANAVLFDSIPFLKKRKGGPDRFLDIGICIIRILESLRQKKSFPLEEAAIIGDHAAYIEKQAKDGVVRLAGGPPGAGAGEPNWTS